LRIALLALAAMLVLPQASGADARSVLTAPRQRVETADYRIVGRLVHVDEKGTRTSLGVMIKAHWFPGVLRVLLEIQSPASARAHILLEMRPKGEDSIRLAHPGDRTPSVLPFDRWTDGPLGPGFSYEDFLEPQYFWPEQTFAGETACGTQKCDMLKSAPGPTDRTHYAEVTTWLGHANGFPVSAEKKLKGSETVKEFTYSGLRHDQGVWSAHQIEAKVRGQEGSTLLIIEHGSARAHLGAADFSPAQITHF
jgi:Outer membrane lipoprotein-sorting protein